MAYITQIPALLNDGLNKKALLQTLPSLGEWLKHYFSGKENPAGIPEDSLNSFIKEAKTENNTWMIRKPVGISQIDGFVTTVMMKVEIYVERRPIIPYEPEDDAE